MSRAPLLVDTAWLAEHLDDEDVRVLDCRVGFERADDDFHIVSGRSGYEKGHVPGSRFADLIGELSDRDGPAFAAPTPDAFAEVLSRLGVDDDTHVVVYDAHANMWAARVWWLLRVFGFENASVLDGGWRKWTREGRPVSTDAPAVTPARFVARPRPERFAAKDEVAAATGTGSGVCILNALTREDHAGTAPPRYGRAGRIPSSVNVPAMEIVDPETHAYLPLAELRARFERVGALGDGKVITYCGGGVAACSAALVLLMLGKDDVAVYDGSLLEWNADPALPVEVDPA